MLSRCVTVRVQPHREDLSKYSAYEVVSEDMPYVLKHRERGFFVSRLPELGLTGYGDTAEEARQKIRKMFCSTAKAKRTKEGNVGLESWLTRPGVTWQWSKGPEDELVY